MLLYPVIGGQSGLLGAVSAAISSARSGQASSATSTVPQSVMPVTLFIWGSGRIVPVRVTGLTITEKLYDSALNPTHAEAQLALRVLTPAELRSASADNDVLAQVATNAYLYTLALRQKLALENLVERGGVDHRDDPALKQEDRHVHSRQPLRGPAHLHRPLPDGTKVTAVIPPLPNPVPLIGYYQRVGPGRLDLIAVQYLNAPTGFWRLCDSNNSMLAGALAARAADRHPRRAVRRERHRPALAIGGHAGARRALQRDQAAGGRGELGPARRAAAASCR